MKPTEKLDPQKTYDIVMKTNCGEFTITLDPLVAPNTTASFVSLTKKGFFDGTVFHRIVPNFVIQGGDPTGTGTGGPGYKTVDVPPANTVYAKGVVAMAKAGNEPPGTSGSQFFVMTEDNFGLQAEYAVIGKVTKGMDVIDRIGNLGGPDERPTQTVEIEQATVVER